MKKRNGIVVDYNVDHYKRGYFPPLREDNYLLSPNYHFILQPPEGKQQIAGNI